MPNEPPRDCTGHTGSSRKNVPLRDRGVGELGVHLASSRLVGETVSDPLGHLLHKSVDRGQENQVVESRQSGCLKEDGQEPGANHAVVDRRADP